MKKGIKLTTLLVVALLSACSGNKGTQQESAAVEKPKVKLALVTVRPVDQTREYTATVEAEVTNHIAPSTPVRISKIFVEVGDRVVKGQKLVQMDAANLKQIGLQLENQRIEFSRIDELYKVGGISKSEWDAAKTALDVRETSYNNLLENTALSCPVNGIVTARNYDDGDMYGGAQPILTVEQIVPVKLVINVSETYFPKVVKGAPATVKLDTYPDEVFEGRISLIYPTVNQATRTFPVEIQMGNRDMKVRPGMFARVTLNFGTENRVVVPDLAVVKQAGSGDRYIFVYKNGAVTYSKVELGRRMGSEYELISGVENNSQAVIAGQSQLIDGMEVEVEAENN
ncbi:MAG: efflux RND transporter periplasmic adaptor subunit [Tannerella sp.]|jgi:RND family efflux transporter MFP subunit|nr:efflux RND transporter periplasmic adaptor subunit [Tannerella sp.]